MICCFLFYPREARCETDHRILVFVLVPAVFVIRVNSRVILFVLALVLHSTPESIII